MIVLPSQSGYRFRDGGAILFICLWALVILGILAIGISSRVASEIRLAKYLQDNVISLYLAKAAVNKLALELEKDETPDCTTRYELQKNRQIQLENITATLDISDEGSLININTAAEAVVASLPGLDAETAKTIVEWTLKPFLLKEELMVLSGITYDEFLGFKNLITTFGDGKININTAGPQVLGVLGLDGSLVEIIVNFRKGPDAEEGTEDDGVFDNAASIVDTLRLYTMLSLLHEQQLLSLISQNIFSAKSAALKVGIETKFASKKIKNYQVILDRTSGKIKFWQER